MVSASNINSQSPVAPDDICNLPLGLVVPIPTLPVTVKSPDKSVLPVTLNELSTVVCPLISVLPNMCVLPVTLNELSIVVCPLISVLLDIYTSPLISNILVLLLVELILRPPIITFLPSFPNSTYLLVSSPSINLAITPLISLEPYWVTFKAGASTEFEISICSLVLITVSF